jgi:glycosyltransferase involved in cell wall biosynthesis
MAGIIHRPETGPAASFGGVQTTKVSGRVSVVIPVYNREATVADAVQSCLAQTFEDIEVIVVDDGSTDRTREVLNGFGARIKVISQANGGVGAARNAGTRVTSGEYVAWMDSDDIAMPERLGLQAGLLASRPDINLVSTDFSAFTTVLTITQSGGWVGLPISIRMRT